MSDIKFAVILSICVCVGVCVCVWSGELTLLSLVGLSNADTDAVSVSTYSNKLSCPRFNDTNFVVLAGDCESTSIPVPRAAERYVRKVDLTEHFTHSDVPDEDLVV